VDRGENKKGVHVRKALGHTLRLGSATVQHRRR